MDGFGSTDTSQITVTLISKYQAIRPQTFDGGGQCRGTSVGSFLPVDIKIVVDKNGTTYRRDTYGFIFHSHLFDDFGNEFMYHAVTATRAVVHGIVVHQSRFFINQILGFDYFFFSHNLFSLSVGESYKKLHQLDEDRRTADVDEYLEIICHEVNDNTIMKSMFNTVLSLSGFIFILFND